MAVKVAVLGGGNGGHAAAADLSNRGFAYICMKMHVLQVILKRFLTPTKSQ